MEEWCSALPHAPPVQHVLLVSEVLHIKAFIHLLEELRMNSAQEKQYFWHSWSQELNKDSEVRCVKCFVVYICCAPICWPVHALGMNSETAFALTFYRIPNDICGVPFICSCIYELQGFHCSHVACSMQVPWKDTSWIGFAKCKTMRWKIVGIMQQRIGAL